MLDEPLAGFCRAVATHDVAAARDLVTPELAGARVQTGASRAAAEDFWVEGIGHYLYAGDTALHIAAAGYAVPVVGDLVEAGAAVAARNRQGATPLHYAADGQPTSSRWDPDAQAATIAALLAAGADPDATGARGVTALHRAVRCRCAAAVSALLAGGADPSLPNRNGSTPRQLATRTTGRGGSGSPEAKAQQEEILALLEGY